MKDLTLEWVQGPSLPMTKDVKNKASRVNALVEFERAGIKYEPESENEVKVICPAHEDSTPSVTFNTEKNIWKCWSADCGAKGDIFAYFAYVAEVDRNVVLVEFGQRYDLSDVKVINSTTIESFHNKIFEAGPLLKELRNRGYKDSWLREDRIGFHNGRITIPIFDINGRAVDVLRYLPGAPGNKKMRHTRGYSTLRLYRPEDLNFDVVWLCGGPVKASVVGHTFKDAKLPVGAISPTGGEGSWDASWGRQFKDKIVYICMDIDAAGVAAANIYADRIRQHAKCTSIIRLPLDSEKFPKGDVNNFIGDEGATSEDLVVCMEKAKEYEPLQIATFTEKGDKDVTLETVSDPTNVGWRLKLEGLVSAMDDTSFLVPKTTLVWCDRKQPVCHKCPVKFEEPDERGFVIKELMPTSQAILSLASTATVSQDRALKSGFSIPIKCRSVEFDVKEHFQVTDLRLSPKLTLSGQGSGSLMQPALLVNCPVDLNVPYIFKGRVYPHPANQKATLVLDAAGETVDSLSSYVCSDEELEQLKIFQSSGTSKEDIQEKLEEIYTDLSCNVTGIYDRFPLHFAYDLTFHSVLFLNLNKRLINGWVNTLIVGDSAQGKSETYLRLQSHYRLGERVECKNATVAGLLGGLQQLNNRWFVCWGVIPTHDRRLVALEEVKGAEISVLGKLTDMRSSGIAEIPKIERRRAHSRTRLLFISNARSNSTMSAYSFGVEAMSELIGAPEDLRRFDLGIVVSAGEVDLSVIHEFRTAEHTFTSDLCHNLVLWAWTRETEDIIISKKALEAISFHSKNLCNKYSENLPLIDRGTIAHKLGRLSAACAARLFSTDEEFTKVFVEEGHVNTVAEFLDTVYSNPNMGYDQYSLAFRTINSLKDESKIRRIIRSSAHPQSLAEGLLFTETFRLSDVQDWMEADASLANYMVSFLVRHHAIRRNQYGYGKTPKFVDLLRELTVKGFKPEKEGTDIL